MAAQFFISSPGCPEASGNAAMMQLLLLYFPRHCIARLKMFALFLVFYAAQNCIAHCVSWVPRLTSLDVMDKLELRSHSQTGTHSYAGDLLYSERHTIQCTNKVNMGIVSGSFLQVELTTVMSFRTG